MAGGGLGREHHRVRSVEDGVRHVRGLGAGRPRAVDHALEHLGRGDDGLPRGIRHGDDPLLKRRHLLGREFDSEIATRHHHAVRFFQDARQVVDRFALLDLRDERRVAAEAPDELLGLPQILGAPHEGKGHEVDAEGKPEGEVGPVLLGESGDGQGDAGQIHALVGLQHASVNHLAMNAVGLALEDTEFEVAVVEENRVAGFRVARKGLVGGADPLRRADHVLIVRDDQSASGLEGDPLGGRHPGGPDLRTGKVLKYRQRLAPALRDGADQVEGPRVVFMRPVREVEPEDRGSRRDQLFENGFAR